MERPLTLPDYLSKILPYKRISNLDEFGYVYISLYYLKIQFIPFKTSNDEERKNSLSYLVSCMKIGTLAREYLANNKIKNNKQGVTIFLGSLLIESLPFDHPSATNSCPLMTQNRL